MELGTQETEKIQSASLAYVGLTAKIEAEESACLWGVFLVIVCLLTRVLSLMLIIYSCFWNSVQRLPSRVQMSYIDFAVLTQRTVHIN